MDLFWLHFAFISLRRATLYFFVAGAGLCADAEEIAQERTSMLASQTVLRNMRQPRFCESSRGLSYRALMTRESAPMASGPFNQSVEHVRGPGKPGRSLSTNRSALAMRAISCRCSGVSLSARARSPLSPPSPANCEASEGSESTEGGVALVAISTINLASWLGSQGASTSFRPANQLAGPEAGRISARYPFACRTLRIPPKRKV